MVLSDEAWHNNGVAGSGGISPEHAKTLYTSLCGFVGKFKKELEKQNLQDQLAVGCGIDYGPMQRIIAFGREDYLGDVINNASEIQHHAWNEIIVSERFLNLLDLKGHELHKLPGVGYRITPPPPAG